MQVSQYSVKIAAQHLADSKEVVRVFHRWIKDDELGELLIDVADYTHVVGGPGIMLVGNAGNYSFDETDGEVGLMFRRKSQAQGSLADRLRDGFGTVLRACALLEKEPAFAGKLSFAPGRLRVQLLDRLRAPNSDETYDTVEPELRILLNELYGDAAIALVRETDPARPAALYVRCGSPPTLGALLGRLQASS